MNEKLIIIDGISNSGKTSFCRYLSEKGYALVDEVPLFIEKNRDRYDVLPASIPKTIDEEKYNQQLLLNAEFGRLFYAKKLILEGKNVIMDRSFLSTLAMAYSLEKDKPFKGSYNNALILTKEYLIALQNLSETVEIIFIIFDVDRSVLLDRNVKRDKPLSQEWIEETFLEKQRTIFKTLLPALKGKTINTSNLSFEEIYKKIVSDINTKKI